MARSHSGAGGLAAESFTIELDIPRAVNRHVRIAETGEVLADTRLSRKLGRPPGRRALSREWASPGGLIA